MEGKGKWLGTTCQAMTEWMTGRKVEMLAAVFSLSQWKREGV
jgi:hypothetical protein